MLLEIQSYLYKPLLLFSIPYFFLSIRISAKNVQSVSIQNIGTEIFGLISSQVILLIFFDVSSSWKFESVLAIQKQNRINKYIRNRDGKIFFVLDVYVETSFVLKIKNI